MSGGTKRSRAAVLAVFMLAAGPRGPAVLPQAYPDTIRAVEANTVVFADGFRLDAGILDPAAPFDAVLRHASVRDMFRLAYPAFQPPAAPAIDFDPGRFRSKAFFDHLYGDCRKGEVEPHLEAVAWPITAGPRCTLTVPPSTSTWRFPIAGCGGMVGVR